MAKDAVGAAFREVYKDEPSIVGKTRKKSGAARAQKQKIAIALSKARATGADIPKKAEGGQAGYQLGGAVRRGGIRGLNPRALGNLPPRVRGMALRGYAEGGPVIGQSGLIAKRQAYEDYVIEAQGMGDTPLTFNQWLQQEQGQPPAMAAQAPATPQVTSDPAMAILRAIQRGARASGLGETFGNELGGEGTVRSLRNYQAGGSVDAELLEPGYYEEFGRGMIPPRTADIAAQMAQERAVRQMMGAGTDVDARARLAKLRALIAKLRGGPMGGESPEVGTRAELLQRLRGFAQGGMVRHMAGEPESMRQEMMEGMSIHHVDPMDEGGFTHETGDDVYTYQAGGPVTEQATGALAQLGQQLLQERNALQNAYQIPPPAQMVPQGPPMGQTAVTQGLQNRLTPNFQMGGAINPRMLRMAARNPRMGMRMTRPGGFRGV